ncbi:kinase-like domain-containing protein [Corynascus novoguineensis]|uniref:mitogen-activated protein kinase kinase n=1 Tax=Corynascus novoguineensis TaxID=1126955 RepID=A0AAN7CJ04_9PEZI|nr:kinase-like domain-containing protein [Corynascus novoguineensis]
MDLPDNEPWPPIPPDVDHATIEFVTPELAVYKYGAGNRKYGLEKAAGECAIPVRGRLLNKQGDHVNIEGFMMDLATPIPQATLHNNKRIIHGDIKPENMLLDSHGRLRLCDFAEGRYMDEDECVWDGVSTWHYESPNRFSRPERYQRDPAPPNIEDDLYALGLSIWQLYIGKIPNGDIASDDESLKITQQKLETVNVGT